MKKIVTILSNKIDGESFVRSCEFSHTEALNEFMYINDIRLENEDDNLSQKIAFNLVEMGYIVIFYDNIYDINDLIKNQDFKFLPEWEMAYTLCEWIKDDIVNDVEEMIKNLPREIRSEIFVNKEDAIVIIDEIQAYLHSYFAPEPDYERDMHYVDSSPPLADVLELIFK